MLSLLRSFTQYQELGPRASWLARRVDFFVDIDNSLMVNILLKTRWINFFDIYTISRTRQAGLMTHPERRVCIDIVNLLLDKLLFGHTEQSELKLIHLSYTLITRKIARKTYSLLCNEHCPIVVLYILYIWYLDKSWITRHDSNFISSFFILKKLKIKWCTCKATNIAVKMNVNWGGSKHNQQEVRQKLC